MTSKPISDQALCQSIVGRIAELASLRLTDDEKAEYQKDFESLIAMFHALDHLEETTEITSIDSQMIDIGQCREDLASESEVQLETSCPHFNKDSNLFDVPQFIADND